MTGRHLALTSGPSLKAQVVGAQRQAMLLWLQYSATSQHLLPRAAGTGMKERLRILGKLLGRRAFLS